MNLDWLAGLFKGLASILGDPLKGLLRLRVWAWLDDAWKRLKSWRDWYRQHVLANLDAQRKALRQLFDATIRPVLQIVDTIRRISQVVGLFNSRLAAQLDVIFLRIESRIAEPFTLALGRINALSSAFTGFLTPMGYLDRATMLNSVWRDIGLLRELIRNPLGHRIPNQPAPSPSNFADLVNSFQSYAQHRTGELEPTVSDWVATFRQLTGN